MLRLFVSITLQSAANVPSDKSCLVVDIPPFQPRCERNQRSRVKPCSLILYSSVPLPEVLESRCTHLKDERTE